jgi:hypothetical protein
MLAPDCAISMPRRGGKTNRTLSAFLAVMLGQGAYAQPKSIIESRWCFAFAHDFVVRMRWSTNHR